MKLYAIIAIIISLILLLFPLAAVGLSQNKEANMNEGQSDTVTAANEKNTEADYNSSKVIKLLRVNSGKVIDVEMYKYIIGAVAGEMPASYEKEALKAQAVASYTYALWLIKNSDKSALSGADISDSSMSHQAYFDEDEMKEKWGDKYEIWYKKIEECVNEVLGEYISYNNEPIIACYHAISPGKTEDAANVWGKDLPYLKSTTAPGDTLAPNADSTVTFTYAEFSKLCSTLEKVTLQDNADKWIGKTRVTDAGFVSSVKIGNMTFNGNDLRTAFSLNSPYFTIKNEDEKIVFSVKGNGHGLGMSQYSADYMARQGSTYDEILMHFYKDTKLVKSN